ncbi:hypothetical protein OTU49_007295, partial [Cherax quadricarinatus]
VGGSVEARYTEPKQYKMLQVLAGTQSNDTTSNIQESTSNIHGPTSNIHGPTSNIHNLPNISENPPSMSEDVGIHSDAQDSAGTIEVPSNNMKDPSSSTQVPPSNTDVPPSEAKSQEAWEKRSEDSLSSDSGLRTPVDCRGRLKLVLTSTPCQIFGHGVSRGYQAPMETRKAVYYTEAEQLKNGSQGQESEQQ